MQQIPFLTQRTFNDLELVVLVLSQTSRNAILNLFKNNCDYIKQFRQTHIVFLGYVYVCVITLLPDGGFIQTLVLSGMTIAWELRICCEWNPIGTLNARYRKSLISLVIVRKGLNKIPGDSLVNATRFWDSKIQNSESTWGRITHQEQDQEFVIPE